MAPGSSEREGRNGRGASTISDKPDETTDEDRSTQIRDKAGIGRARPAPSDGQGIWRRSEESDSLGRYGVLRAFTPVFYKGGAGGREHGGCCAAVFAEAVGEPTDQRVQIVMFVSRYPQGTS